MGTPEKGDMGHPVDVLVESTAGTIRRNGDLLISFMEHGFDAPTLKADGPFCYLPGKRYSA